MCVDSVHSVTYLLELTITVQCLPHVQEDVVKHGRNTGGEIAGGSSSNKGILRGIDAL